MSAKQSTLIGSIVVVALLIPQIASAKVDIVATLGDLGAAAREVGGKHAEVTTLAAPQEDPHFVDAKPSYIKDVAQADLLVLNGMSLEIGWLPTLIDNSRNSAVQKGQPGYFDASTVIERKEVPKTEITRQMGDVHPDGNPHYTVDPRQMARVAIALGNRLGELDPEHAEYFDKQARSFAKECLKVARKWKERFNKLADANRKVAVYHEAWIYVLDWLNLDRSIAVEPKPGVEPNPRHVKEVIDVMKSNDVKLILRMEYYPSAVVDQIADKVGVKVVTSQGQAREDHSYVERVNKLASAIYDTVK